MIKIEEWLKKLKDNLHSKIRDKLLPLLENSNIEYMLAINEPKNINMKTRPKIYIKVNFFKEYYGFNDSNGIDIWCNAWYYILFDNKIYFDFNLYCNLLFDKNSESKFKREEQFQKQVKDITDNYKYNRDIKKVIFYYFNDTLDTIKINKDIKMFHPVFLNEITVNNKYYDDIKPFETVRFILVGTDKLSDIKKTFLINRKIYNPNIKQAILNSNEKYEKIDKNKIISNIYSTLKKEKKYMDLNKAYNLLKIVEPQIKDSLEKRKNLEHLQQHILNTDEGACYRICYNSNSTIDDIGDIITNKPYNINLSVLHNPFIPPKEVYLNTLTKMIYINFTYIHYNGIVFTNTINLHSNNINLYFVNTKKNITLDNLFNYIGNGTENINTNVNMDKCNNKEEPLFDIIENNKINIKSSQSKVITPGQKGIPETHAAAVVAYSNSVSPTPAPPPSGQKGIPETHAAAVVAYRNSVSPTPAPPPSGQKEFQKHMPQQ